MTTWEALADAAGRNYIRKLDRADLEHAGDVPAREAAYAATLCELVEALGFTALASRYRRDAKWWRRPRPDEAEIAYPWSPNAERKLAESRSAYGAWPSAATVAPL